MCYLVLFLMFFSFLQVKTTMVKDPATDESDVFWDVNFKHGSSLKASEYHDRYIHCIMNLE